MRKLFILGPLTLICAWGQFNEDAAKRKLIEEKMAMAKSGGAPPDGKVVKGAPYTAIAVTTSTQKLADGNRISRRMEMPVARDSEGRTRREQTLAAVGQWATRETGSIVYIQDPVAQVQYMIPAQGQVAIRSSDPRAMNKQKEEMLAKIRHAEGEEKVKIDIRVEAGQKEAKSQRVEQLGEQVMEGVRVQGRRTVLTIEAGVIGNELPLETVSEVWYSPELETIVMSRRSDPRVGDTEYRLTNLQRAEPARSLFEPPPGYTIKEEARRSPDVRK